MHDIPSIIPGQGVPLPRDVIKFKNIRNKKGDKLRLTLAQNYHLIQSHFRC